MQSKGQRWTADSDVGRLPIKPVYLIADLDATIVPTISVPRALTYHATDGFLNVHAFRRRRCVVNCWRRRRAGRESATKQHSTKKTARYTRGNLAVLSICGRGRQK
jgi:hypothetical protein